MDYVLIQITLVTVACACLFFERGIRYAAPGYLVAASAVNLLHVLKEPRGWDFGVFCNAGEAIRRGLNPYLMEHMSRISEMKWTYVYPAVTAFLFQPACPRRQVLYPVLYLFLLAGVFLLFASRRAEGSLYLAAILSAGFLGLHWNIKTGNIGILELFLLALCLWFFRRSSFAASGACLGGMAAFKIMPLLYAPLVLLTGPGRQTGNFRRFVIGAGATFAVVQGLSALLFPGLFPSYIRQLLGLQRGQESPLGEFAYSDPTNPAFLPSVRAWTIKVIGGYGTWMILVALLLWLFWRMLRDVSRWRSADPEGVLSFGILIATLCLPRLKPYSVVWATLPLYLVTRHYPWRWRSGVLFLSCALPFLWLLEVVRPWGVFHQLMWTYQTTSLFLAVLLIYLFERSRALKQATEGA